MIEWEASPRISVIHYFICHMCTQFDQLNNETLTKVNIIYYRIVANRKALQISIYMQLFPHDLSSENNRALNKNMSSVKIKIILN